MAFAVIQTGGKQYRVSPGTVLSVEKLEGEQGSTLVFDKVLMYQNEDAPVLGAPFIVGATVSAQLVAQRKSAKIRVFTYKAKKRQKRTLGHRQQLTQIKILDIVPAAKAAKPVAKN